MAVFTKTIVGVYITPGIPCTATLYVVFPPGMDAYLPAITPQTLTKNNAATAYAAGAVVSLNGSLIVGTGSAHLGVVATASGSGSPTVDVRVLPDIDWNALASPAGNSGTLRNDGGLTGPGSTGWHIGAPGGPYPVTASGTLYGYTTAGGVTGYTATVGTATANPQSWVAGYNYSTEPDPAATFVNQLVLADGFSFDFASPWSYPACAEEMTKYQVTGTINPGVPVYLDETGAAAAASASSTYVRYVGTCVFRDTSTSPMTIGVMPPTGTRVGRDGGGRQFATLIRPHGQRMMLDSTNLDLTGPARIGIETDFGRLAFVSVCRIATAWDTSGTVAPQSVPTAFAEVVIPRLTGCPSIAIDVTLPAPFGACRIVWYGGCPHLCVQAGPSTTPRSGMARTGMESRYESTEQNQGTGGELRNHISAMRNLPGWGNLPYPLAIYPGQCGSGNFSRAYGLTGWNGTCDASPARIGDIPDILIRSRFLAGGGALAVRVFASWVRIDFVNTIAAPAFNAWFTSASGTQLLAGATAGGLLIANDTITIKPTGSAEDIGVFMLKFDVRADYTGSPDVLVATTYTHPFSRGSGAGNWLDGLGGFTATTDYGMTEAVTGSVMKTVWPLDIQRWAPTANDADCSWVGNTGWAYPTPPRRTDLTFTGSFTVSWSAGSFTVSAKPTPTATVVTGAAFVRTLDLLTNAWGFHARLPSLGLVYSPIVAGSFPSGSGTFYWTGLWAGLRITETAATMPKTFNANRPVAASTPAEVGTWPRAEWYSDWGNLVRAAGAEQRTTLSVG